MRKNKKLKENAGVKTISIHHGDSFSQEIGCIMPPIYATSTFEYGNKGNFDYTRSGNPNFKILENVLKAIEDANYCTAFSSGIAAVTAITSSLKSGDKILCESNLYGCTIRMFEKVFKKFGIKIFYCDFTTKKYIEKIANVNPTLIWLESPTNPLLKVLNLKEICKEANSKNIPVVVDNTFCTALIQNPLKLGATLSLISTTKFINGHSDALGGAVLTNNEDWNSKMLFAQKSLGLNPSPFDCWLITRGIKTLPIRMDQQARNAEIISQELNSHKLIEELIYPFSPNHPQFKLAKMQMRMGGSIISLKLKLNKDNTFIFCKKLKYFALAESLGGVESLICHPATMSHASIDKDTKNKLGINDSLVRLSIGCEDSDDLLSDILSVLDNFQL
ncbi:MAG: cystathionine gamma-synthase [Prochlorococcus sp. SP3034]|nr:cystathionine gamma-synthase [Prochlorococcus sp. SP3034]|tara:strand:- start:18960 stop:20129 length:1170 start_codon:yes stop_codon:yes gene_type:complete